MSLVTEPAFIVCLSRHSPDLLGRARDYGMRMKMSTAREQYRLALTLPLAGTCCPGGAHRECGSL